MPVDADDHAPIHPRSALPGHTAPLGHMLRHVIALSFRDYRHEWQMSVCFVLALATVLAPMLLLFGLKFGIITGMMDRLVEEPRNREIRVVGSGRFDTDWIKAMAHDPAVAFVVPRTRALSATMQLQKRDGGAILTVEQIPSAAGDPLLGAVPPPRGVAQVVLSETAAKSLALKPGDRVDGSIARLFRGRRERVHIALEVVGVASHGAFSRAGLFVSVALLSATEDFRDGRAVSRLGWQGTSEVNEEDRTFAGFRLYTRAIDDVAGMRARLHAQGVKVVTQAAEIELVQSMDRNLSLVFWLVVWVGFVGFSLSLGASLWANVERKQRALSVLRLMGFRTGAIVWFPVMQSLFTGIFGWLLAIVLYAGVARAINHLFLSHAASGQAICTLRPLHLVIALGLTLGSAVLAAILGGVRAARLEPADALREL